MTNTKPKTRLFGTDGIRGRYGEGNLTDAAVTALGCAVGRAFQARSSAASPSNSPEAKRVPRALVGHDGRHSGPTLEAAITRGLGAAGFEIDTAGLIPTPGLAHLGRTKDYDLAVMISASHNHAADNGIKIFGPDGDKLADSLEDAIEEELQRLGETPLSEATPRHSPELENDYLEHLLTSVELKLDGLVIVLDCANGAGSRVAPRILGRLGAQVIPIGCEPDGDNINEGCGSTHPGGLLEAVRLHGADLGIALDGDGDRCILCDEHGSLVNGDGILTMLSQHAAAKEQLQPKKIVATIMSNRGLHRAMHQSDIQVVTVGVGDRRVVEALRAEDLPLGGEQSGHIVFGADNAYIGDGTYTALRCLQVIVETGKSLSELVSPYQPFPQILINVTVSTRPELESLPTVAAHVKKVVEHLGEEGRVLLRYSGTEPLARVMVEGPDEDWIRTQAQEIANLIATEIGA